MKTLLLLLTAVLLGSRLAAEIIHVPAGQPTIQKGIDMAREGDTVLVDPGTYMENINFNGKHVTVASLFLTTHKPMYISQTIIDGNYSGSVVTISNSEDKRDVLCGLTITNGNALLGGGIYCYESGPTIRDVVITGNMAHGVTNWAYGGGGICCCSAFPLLQNLTIKDNRAMQYGGGIYCFAYSFVTMKNVTISNNSAGYGGGIYSGASMIVFDPDSRCNIYLNDAAIANDFFYTTPYDNGTDEKKFFQEDPDGLKNPDSSSTRPAFHVVVDTFTVAFPTEFHAYGDGYSFTFDILHAKIPQTDADLYVSPKGDNNNDGLTPDSPLKTIHQAFRIIRADVFHQHTVHLLEGTYRLTSNGEVFPLFKFHYVDLDGSSPEEVILDAEGKTDVVYILYDHLSNMTVINGLGAGISCGGGKLENLVVTKNDGGGIYIYGDATLKNIIVTENSAFCGGGIYCSNCHPILDSMTISDNTATGEGEFNIGGGGIYCIDANLSIKNSMITGNRAYNSGGVYCESSEMIMTHVTIAGNSANGSGGTGACGGGIGSWASTLTMSDLTIKNNTATTDQLQGGCGGGIYCQGTTSNMQKVNIIDNLSGYGGGIFSQNFSTIEFSDSDRCNIYDNEAYTASDLYSENDMEVIVDTFTVINPTEYHAYPLSNFSFDILHYKKEVYDTDIYVSPDGNNENSGTSANDPFKTLHYAFTRILADSIHPNTIHLLAGTYSPTINGERFPVRIPDDINVSGSSENDVILDAEGVTGVIEFVNNDHTMLSGLSVTGANEDAEGAIYCENANPVIQHVSILGNACSGIKCYDHSSPVMTEVTISGNSSEKGGAINCEDHSNPVINKATLSDNSSIYGGAIYCVIYSNPVLNHAVLSDNIADYGGGMYGSINSSPILQTVQIINNEADKGGGLYVQPHSNPSLTAVTIAGNTALDCGGGIYCQPYSDVEIINSVISENTATKGGGLYCEGPLFGLHSKNVTITGNEAQQGGGIFCSNGATPVLCNTILWDDTPEEVYFNAEGDPDAVTLSWSDIKGGQDQIMTNDNGTVNWLEGNIDADPLFVWGGEDPYALSDNSPCIDAGIPDTAGLSLPPWDILGNQRIWDGNGDGLAVIDMGPYEYGALPVGVENSKLQVAGCRLQVFPNPGCGEVFVRYEVPVGSRQPAVGSQVSLSMYNTHGKKIKTLVNEYQMPDEYTVCFDAADLPTGIYLIRLQAGDASATRKLVMSH
jgi:predicted outer membrane repeat protein